MKYCSNCGNKLETQMTHCAYCGVACQENSTMKETDVLYHLPSTTGRPCDIKIFSNEVVFEGKFWYLRDKEFYVNKQPKENALISNFLGMGYLEKRSYKKSVAFVVGGVLLEVINLCIDRINEWADKANFFLKFVGENINIPGWVNIVPNILIVICLFMAILLFFSKKKVLEISFVDKRICVSQKGISNEEFMAMYRVISKLREKY